MTNQFAFRTDLMCSLHVLSTCLFTAAVPVFDVRDYGAKGDGEALDTAAIQGAIEATDPAGGAIGLQQEFM